MLMYEHFLALCVEVDYLFYIVLFVFCLFWIVTSVLAVFSVNPEIFLTGFFQRYSFVAKIKAEQCLFRFN